MKKILIIEDDPIVAHVYRTRLENETYAVETCSDGQSGYNHAHEMNPDAILLDLMLPRMNGIEFLKKIRAQSRFVSIPIVVFTNAYLPEMIQEALSCGASHVYNKATLTPKQLLDCLYFLIHGKNRISEPPSFSGGGGTTLTAKPVLSLPEHPGSPPPPANYGYNDNYTRGPAPAPTAAPDSASQDAFFFDAALYREFIAAKPETIADLRAAAQEFIKDSDEALRDRHLLHLHRKVHALTARASLANFGDAAQISSALEVLLKELHEQPKHINVSTLRTVAQSVEFIGELLNLGEPRGGNLPPPNILVVDDELLSRRAIVHALEKGNLKSSAIEDTITAFRMVCEQEFDLIILDIHMPALDGFELCSKIRAFPTNRDTPVLFVTRLTDFKSRARATVCGGNDFVAKPFFFIEVTLKALTLILRKRLLPRAKAA